MPGNPRTRPRWTNSWPVAIALTAICTALAGCTWLDPQAKQQAAERDARNQAEEARLDKELDTIPGVVGGGVSYVYDPITNPGEAWVNLKVRQGADLERVAEQAAEMVWRSRLHPLIGFTVGITSDTPDHTPTLTRYYVEPEQWEELERKYGPRPVPQED